MGVLSNHGLTSEGHSKQAQQMVVFLAQPLCATAKEEAETATPNSYKRMPDLLLQKAIGSVATWIWCLAPRRVFWAMCVEEWVALMRMKLR